MITAQTIIAYVEELSGHPLNRDEGIHHGSGEREGKRVLVCWMATPKALSRAGQKGCDLVLAHESLYYPYDAVVRTDNPSGWERWRTNELRKAALEEHDLTFVRIHGSLDEICIFDEFPQPVFASTRAVCYTCLRE